MKIRFGLIFWIQNLIRIWKKFYIGSGIGFATAFNESGFTTLLLGHDKKSQGELNFLLLFSHFFYYY